MIQQPIIRATTYCAKTLNIVQKGLRNRRVQCYYRKNLSMYQASTSHMQTMKLHLHKKSTNMPMISVSQQQRLQNQLNLAPSEEMIVNILNRFDNSWIKQFWYTIRYPGLSNPKEVVCRCHGKCSWVDPRAFRIGCSTFHQLVQDNNWQIYHQKSFIYPEAGCRMFKCSKLLGKYHTSI